MASSSFYGGATVYVTIPSLSATSTDSITIGTGALTFNTQAGKAFSAGMFLTIASGANNANYMHGQVTSYSDTVLVMNITDVGGAGTFADWDITLSGSRGSAGATGATGAGYTATSTTSLVTAGTGSKSFTTQSGLAYTVGARIRATSAGTSEWMEGVVTSYSGTTLVATMDKNSGTGTHADWNINAAGQPGVDGSGSPANPTATVGLSAVNGTATTYLRSDGAPALDQSIAPTWTGAHIWNATVTFNRQMLRDNAVSPAQITADQNDYNPANLSTTSVLRLNTDASRNVTGLAGGASGRMLKIVNVGSFNIVLKDQSASSTAANRFQFGQDFTVPANGSIELWYDTTLSRWVRAGAAGALFAANNLSDVTAATARTNLGLAIGTNVQAWDADLDTLASLGNWKVSYTNGSGNQVALTVGAAGTALAGNGVTAAPSWQGVCLTANNLSDVTAATARTNLGLGSIATFPETTAAQYQANTSGKALSTDKVWSAAAEVALTDAATIAVDMSTGWNFAVTLGGNRTLGNPTNTKVGQTGYIRLAQDGTGSRTLAYSSSWKFPASTAPTLTTTLNKVDYLYYIVRSSTEIAANLVNNVG